MTDTSFKNFEHSLERWRYVLNSKAGGLVSVILACQEVFDGYKVRIDGKFKQAVLQVSSFTTTRTKQKKELSWEPYIELRVVSSISSNFRSLSSYCSVAIRSTLLPEQFLRYKSCIYMPPMQAFFTACHNYVSYVHQYTIWFA